MSDLATCTKCAAGKHRECQDWPSCLCAMQGHQAKGKRPRRWGRKNEPGKKPGK